MPSSRHCHHSRLRRRILTAAALFLITSAALPPAGAAGGTVRTEDGLEISIDDTGEVTSLLLGGRELVRAPDALLSIRVRRHASRADSLLAEGAMEDGDGDGTIDGWTRSLTPARLELSAVPRACSGLPGDAALRFRVTSSIKEALYDAVHSGWVPVTPGQTYRVEGWALATRGYLGKASGALQSAMLERYENPGGGLNGIKVLFADANRQKLGDLIPLAPVGVNARGCKRFGAVVRAPSGAAWARVELGARLGKAYATGGEPEAVIYDEILFAPSPDLVCEGEGALAGQGNRLDGTLSFPGTGLEAQLRLLGLPDRIRIEGQLRDPSLGEHAVELSVGLPLDPAGFRFAAEPRADAPIAAEGLQERTTSAAGSASMPISLYPMVSVDDGSSGTLALLLPRDEPRFARLRWDADAGRYEAVFLLGLSPLAENEPSRAGFRLDLLAADPSRGWRGAWEKSFRIDSADHPSWFRPVYNDAANYGEFHQGHFENDPASVQADDAANDYSAQYVLFDFNVVDLGTSDDEPPDYDELMQIIEERKSSEPTEKQRAYYRAADATLSGDDNGDRVFKLLAITDWSGGQYQANLLSNVDPEIDGGLAHWFWQYKIEPAIHNAADVGACLDGVEFDNLFLSNLDYREDRIQLADFPLTFTESSLRPGRHSADGVWHFLVWLRQRVESDPDVCPDFGFSGNWWAPGTVPAISSRFDFFVGEGSRMTTHEGIWRDDMLLARRAISYRKGFGAACKTAFGDADEEAFRRVQEKAMLYATKAVKWKDTTWGPAIIDLADNLYHPLAATLQAAGWEPETFATADLPGIHLERYGRVADGNLHIAVLNRSGAGATFTLTLEKAPLGIESVTEIRDLVRDEVLTATDLGDRLEIDDTLDTDRGRVLAIDAVVADADTDGVIDAEDCAPDDPSAFSAPPRIRDLTLAQSATTDLSWSDPADVAGPGTTSDITGGVLGDLLASGGFSAASCMATGLDQPHWSDERPGPSPGEGLYYLVRGRNTCADGPWGYGSDLLRRVLPDCP